MKSLTQIDYGALAIAGLCLLLGSAVNAEATGRIEICHKAGERGQRILLIDEEIDGEKHFGHGDYVIAPEVCDGFDSDCEKPPVADNDVDCSDNFACTIDSCSGLDGCINLPDDNSCGTGETCDPTHENADEDGCVAAPVTCLCATWWANSDVNGVGVNFPGDFVEVFSETISTAQYNLTYKTTNNEPNRWINVSFYTPSLICIASDNVARYNEKWIDGAEAQDFQDCIDYAQQAIIDTPE